MDGHDPKCATFRALPNLDFAYLKDLSTIDFELRVLILRMTGDIEHALRIRFNNLLSQVDEDGYQVIRDYENEQAKYCKENGKSYDPDSSYQKSVYTKGGAVPFCWTRR